MTPTHATPIDRTAINRANAKHSTGPRTDSGKQRSSQNALRHGLTAETAVLPTEDPAAYQRHIQQFLDEYRPATPTETHLVQELADIAWRQNRIPLLEAELLSRGMNPPSEQARIDFDIVDAHRAIATLGMHGQRLNRQFHKTLDQLRAIQRERREQEKKELKEAASLFEGHKHKGIPFEPGDYGFVFSKEEIERHALKLSRLNLCRFIAFTRFDGAPMPLPGSNKVVF
jgi:hypothetical protein